MNHGIDWHAVLLLVQTSETTLFTPTEVINLVQDIGFSCKEEAEI